MFGIISCRRVGQQDFARFEHTVFFWPRPWNNNLAGNRKEKLAEIDIFALSGQCWWYELEFRPVTSKSPAIWQIACAGSGATSRSNRENRLDLPEFKLESQLFSGVPN